jgi:DNA-binding CsgD family transcriptional regulator
MKTALPVKNERWFAGASVNLTGRQRQILHWVSIGHTNKEIANIMRISVRTVEVHRFKLMRRLHVRNVAQLLRRALHLDLLSSHDMRSPLANSGIAGSRSRPVSEKHGEIVMHSESSSSPEQAF